jgi:hypothetical protein
MNLPWAVPVSGPVPELVLRKQVLRGFFFPILWCSWSGDHPQDDWVRFGPIPDMRVEKKTRILVYSLLPSGTFIKIWQSGYYFSLKSDKFGSFFSWKNNLHKPKSVFFQENLWNFAQKRTSCVFFIHACLLS